MIKRPTGHGVSGPFDPFGSIKKIATSYTDEKIVLARKLYRDGYTYEQMAPLLGYKNGVGVAQYFKVNNLPKPSGYRGSVHHHTEEQKKSQSEKMEKYWAAKGKHPNDWRKPLVKVEEKDGAMKITLPEWAEEAATLREGGMSGPAIAKKLGVSDAYVYTTLNILSGKGTTKVPWAQDAIKAASEGKTNKEIAKTVGVTANRVRDVLAQHQASIQYRKNKEAKAASEVSPMADRQFEVTHQTDNGVTRNGVLIRCGTDGCHKVERFIRSHGTVNPTQAAQYFRTKGWIIGGGPRADRCPDHAYSKKPAEPVKKEDMSPFRVFKEQNIPTAVDAPTPPVPAPVPMQATAESVAVEEPIRHMVEEHEEAQKTMSKADRRIIFNKIEDVYGDETIGYKGDWSDAKVSEDLGVKVEWVSLIREENFGPAHNQVAALAEAREAGQKVMDNIDEIKSLFADMESLHAKLMVKKDEYAGLAKEFIDLYKTIAK